MSHHGGHGYPRTQQIRQERRARAEKQQQEYNEKYPTLQAKLAALPEGGAKKQRARLEALIAKQAAKQAEKKEAAPEKQEQSKPKGPRPKKG